MPGEEVSASPNQMQDTIQKAYIEEIQRYAKYFGDGTTQSGEKEELKTTPLFSLSAKCAVDQRYAAESHGSSDGTVLATNNDTDQVFCQFSLLGFRIGHHQHLDNPEPLFMNTNAPNSTFICGSQGSGKSYTLACMLENCLLGGNCPGNLSQPVAGVVFHYDLDSSLSGAEAAHLCSQGIKTRVLVSRSNRNILEDVYTKLEGASENLTVEPLLLQPHHLTVESMLKLMSYSDQEGHAPLYMAVVQKILREMAVECGGSSFNYLDFKFRVERSSLTKEQQNLLGLRLGLLESFLDLNRSGASSKDIFSTEPGTLTIIDLSDPFVNTSTVCLLFEICLTLLKRNRPSSGLVVALDEAHKFMDASEGTMVFTDRLLTTVREQRHNATRVIIATQEPTISEKLMELSSITIVHRFTSPTWFTAIKSHLGGASSLITTSESQSTMFENIMNLKVGESMLFSPASFLCIDKQHQPGKLGSGVIKMKTRIRLSADGGKSELASGEKANHNAELSDSTTETVSWDPSTDES